MSHIHVGNTYDAIIKDVIDSSTVDFEEGGVEEAVLDELRAGWQRKLSQLGVATFPWDPKPEPTVAHHPPPQVAVPEAPQHDVAGYTQTKLSPQQPNVQPLSAPVAPPPVAMQNGASPAIKPEPGVSRPEPAIKQEPGQQHMTPVPAPVPMYTPAQMRGAHVTVAAQRAAQALEGQFGTRAAASINAIHAGMPQAGQLGQAQGSGAQGPRPGSLLGAPQPLNTQQYRQQIAHTAALQHQRAQQQAAQQAVPNGVVKSQVDGPADATDAFEGILVRRAADGATTELGRVEIDRMLHDQIAANAKRMEGGGLMLPLKQAAKGGRRGAAGAKKRAAPGVAQHDGPADDDDDDDDIKEEEQDEDAINSDLDDPEENLDDDEDDDEAMGHIMLCMWDKVQRVKNKWKCTLKDGVLTVNGKEYVFHKATGEYEW